MNYFSRNVSYSLFQSIVYDIRFAFDRIFVASTSSSGWNYFLNTELLWNTVYNNKINENFCSEILYINSFDSYKNFCNNSSSDFNI